MKIPTVWYIPACNPHLQDNIMSQHININVHTIGRHLLLQQKAAPPQTSDHHNQDASSTVGPHLKITSSDTLAYQPVSTITNMNMWFAITGAILLMVIVLFIINKIIDFRVQKRQRLARRHHVSSREGSFKRNSIVRTSVTATQSCPPGDRQHPSTHLFLAFVSGARRHTTTSIV